MRGIGCKKKRPVDIRTLMGSPASTVRRNNRAIGRCCLWHFVGVAAICFTVAIRCYTFVSLDFDASVSSLSFIGMGLFPKLPSKRERIDVQTLPPGDFISGLM